MAKPYRLFSSELRQLKDKLYQLKAKDQDVQKALNFSPRAGWCPFCEQGCYTDFVTVKELDYTKSFNKCRRCNSLIEYKS